MTLIQRLLILKLRKSTT